jgi:hypothetical protein
LGVTHWRFLATLDSKTTVQCAANDGKTFPVGEGPMPPLHANCFPGDTVVSSSSGVASVTKRRFDGEVCVIRTASGQVLTATPNHPILTSSGWVGIGRLGVGDHVVRDRSGKWRAVVDGHGQYVPSTIHDVAESFFASPNVVTVPVPVSAPDFHGDASDGDVAVVGADRSLLAKRYASVAQHVDQVSLVGADLLAPRSRSPRQLFRPSLAPANSLVSRSGKRLALMLRSASHACKLLLRAVAGSTPMTHKELAYNAGGWASEVPSDSCDSDPFVEHADSLDGVDFHRIDRPAGSHGRATAPQEPVDLGAADARLAHEILDGRTGLVSLDEIVDVHREWFAGDVFNMETGRGFYTANGLIVHNCRSVAVPDFRGKPIGTRASIDGQVPAATDYESWLATQSISEQNTVLGKTKAEAWRAGKITLKQMLGRDLQPLTLAELRRLDRI